MITNNLQLVSFVPADESFRGFIDMAAIVAGDTDLERSLRRAERIYQQSCKAMRAMVAELERRREQRAPIAARKMWDFGDLILKLVDRLRKQTFEIDGLYDHLVRDLGVKRMWIEKALIFRRHIPNRSAIPISLRWGRCTDSPRRTALEIVRLAQGG